MDFAIPVLLPHTKSLNSFDFTLNFFVQGFVTFILSVFMFCYVMLFIIFTGHLVTEIRYLNETLSVVGEDEDARYKTFVRNGDDRDDFLKSSNILKNAVSLHNEIIR